MLAVAGGDWDGNARLTGLPGPVFASVWFRKFHMAEEDKLLRLLEIGEENMSLNEYDSSRQIMSKAKEMNYSLSLPAHHVHGSVVVQDSNGATIILLD